MKNIELRQSGDKTYITLNFLGGIQTFARNDDKDIDNAIEEAVTCFLSAAREHGLGIRRELKMIGSISESGK